MHIPTYGGLSRTSVSLIVRTATRFSLTILEDTNVDSENSLSGFFLSVTSRTSTSLRMFSPVPTFCQDTYGFFVSVLADWLQYLVVCEVAHTICLYNNYSFKNRPSNEYILVLHHFRDWCVRGAAPRFA